MSDPVEERIASLHQLSTVELRRLWMEAFKTDTCPPLRKNLLIPVLAFRLQEQAFGTLPPDLRKRLRELTKNSSGSTISAPAVKPGTRLVREWRGKSHVVTITEGGYDYQGCRFQSLSEIARQITGTRWSGPLFFGLRDIQSKVTSAR
jgi:hypothetical protein